MAMWTLLTVLFVIISGTVSKSPCNYHKSVPLVQRRYNGFYFEENEYFVHNITGEERGCVCLKGVCARKCCQFGQTYNPTKKVCMMAGPGIEFDPIVRDEVTGKNGSIKDFIFIHGKMDCDKRNKERRLPVYPATLKFHLVNDGTLHVKVLTGIPDVLIYGPDKYCIDTFVPEGQEPHLNALICYVPQADNNSYALSSSCMLISCFFILLTVAVYTLLPQLRNLHGMVLMAYLLSFFVGFLFLATMQILILMKEMTQDICLIITFIVYFSLLAAFFWLNVMCFDIWWTFSGFRGRGQSGSIKKRFFHYALYAFGVPTALTILLGALEFTNHPSEHPLLPRLRLQGCFLYGNSKLLYLYGPIVILCIANMTFFGLTAYKIAKIKAETKKMLETKESSTNAQDRSKDTQRFSLYVKLFTVMGINWILEVISSFYPEADYIWQFSDAYNVLVGLIIFIIFVCKKKTWKMIKNRYNQLMGKPMSRTQTISFSTRVHSTSCDELEMDSIQK